MSDVMNTAMNEETRKVILELCLQTAPIGAGIPVLKAAMRKFGYQLTDQELQLHTAYLTEKKLLRCEEVKNERLGINRKILFITAEGIDYLEGNGPDVVGVN